MSRGRTLEFRIVSDPTQLPRVRDEINTWLVQAGWARESVADLVLAVDEALTNVIRHGYEGRVDQPIHVDVRLLRRPRPGVEVSIRDFGRQVDVEEIRGRDLDDLRPGGLGVHIIRSVMDEVEYSHAEGGGMRLVIRKFREDGQSPANGNEDE